MDNWNDEDFKESGIKGVDEFVGRMTDVEEDVEGKYGNQVAISWEDAEVTASAEPVALNEGRIIDWVPDKHTKGSTKHRMYLDWKAFATEHGIAPLPSGLYGKLIRYRKATYDYGGDINPGTAFVPVELMEGGVSDKLMPQTAAGKSAGKAPGKTATPSSDNGSGLDPSEELTSTILAALGTDGATRDLVRREVVKKAATRNAMTKCGGLDAALAFMVANNSISEDEGYYFPADGGTPAETVTDGAETSEETPF